MDLLKEFEDIVDNDYSSIVSDGIVGDNYEFIDTGSYMLNALISGSINGGFPSNKVTAFAGESSVGKTYYLLQAIIGFFTKYPKGRLVFFESESALTKAMFEERGIPTKQILFLPVETIQEFRTQALRILNKYEDTPVKKRPPLMLALDSLGNLSTKKEVEDIAEGSDKRDMTRSQLIRGSFRALTLKMGKVNVPLILTNHTYTTVGSFIAQQEVSGGGGLKYAASSIITFTKAQDKVKTDVVGGIITAYMYKSRITREKKKVKTQLSFQNGLNPWYGLLEFGEEHGIFSKSGNKWLMGEKKLYEKAIYKDPEQHFTPEIMEQLDKAAKRTFPFGSAVADENVEVEAS